MAEIITFNIVINSFVVSLVTHPFTDAVGEMLVCGTNENEAKMNTYLANMKNVE